MTLADNRKLQHQKNIVRLEVSLNYYNMQMMLLCETLLILTPRRTSPAPVCSFRSALLFLFIYDNIFDAFNLMDLKEMFPV